MGTTSIDMLLPAAVLCLLIRAGQVLPHTLVLAPVELSLRTPENICVVDGHKGRKGGLTVTLHHLATNTELFHVTMTQMSSCFQLVIPDMDVSNTLKALAKLRVRSEGENPRVNITRDVLLKSYNSLTFVQTDKPVYKPGQTVRFRVVSLNEKFIPTGEKYPLVTLQDPKRNLIHQWAEVHSQQGIADLSFDLIPDSLKGSYELRVKKTRGEASHHFTVEEYVLPKFDFKVHLPKVVLVLDKTIHLKVCGRYTYGKPMRGHVNGTLCLRPHYRYTSTDLCYTVEGETNLDGCFSEDVPTEKFRLRNNWNIQDIFAEIALVEEGTGITRMGIARSRISNEISQLTFEDMEDYFKKGISFTGKVRIKYMKKKPMAGVKIYLFHSQAPGMMELHTNDYGWANFSLDTTTWGVDPVSFQAIYQLPLHSYSRRVPRHGVAQFTAKPFYSRSGSFLSIEKVRTELPCDGEIQVPVRYFLDGGGKVAAKDILFFSLVMVRGKIQHLTSLDIKDQERKDRYFRLHLPLSPELAPVAQIFIFAILPIGELIGDTVRYKVSKCFKNKVHLDFSRPTELPNSPVTLDVQADPSSLCGLRVVDQSVLLLKPEKELSADSVYKLLPVRELNHYPYPLFEDTNEFCGPPSGDLWPTQQNRDSVFDVAKLLEAMGLKVATDLDYHVRLNCEIIEYMYTNRIQLYASPGAARYPAGPPGTFSLLLSENTQPGIAIEDHVEVREYFPETWIWDLVSVGPSGRTSLDLTTPDTVTEWKGKAFCVGQHGFGLSDIASLTIFKPFFVEMALPYSVVRTEIFVLKAKIFNYLSQSLRVKVSLLEADGFEVVSSEIQPEICVLAKDGFTVSWKLKASHLGISNITVRAESINYRNLCGNEVVTVPAKGAVDTVRQSILIQPEGTEIQLTHSTLSCPQGKSVMEEIPLELPADVVHGSERGYFMVQGDIMSSAMENLENLLTLPTGCGEQNMVKFAPNIFVLSYLENTEQASPKVKAQAIHFLESGYKRQLNYKHSDGSFSAFGEGDPEGNTWLTAFVLKSFIHAQKHIFIDEKILKESAAFFLRYQMKSGCFAGIGRLFNNAMKGGVDDHITLSAYVTIALLEFQKVKPEMANEIYEEFRKQEGDKDPYVGREEPEEKIPPADLKLQTAIIDPALSCLRDHLDHVNSSYALALAFYTFSLANDLSMWDHLLHVLDERSVHEDGLVHLQTPAPPGDTGFWWRARSVDVEANAYWVLGLISAPIRNRSHLVTASQVVSWLVRQRNAHGGFASTQDTIVALQALSLYGSLTHLAETEGEVSVTGPGDFVHKFHVDASNRLVVQRVGFPTVPANYVVHVIGSGCLLLQTSLLYNKPPSPTPSAFKLSVHPDPLDLDHSMGKIYINITYTGSRNSTNMAIVDIKLPSGFSADFTQDTTPSISRTELQPGNVVLYLHQLEAFVPVQLWVSIHRDILVENLQESVVKVYDYYETNEFAIAGYQWTEPSEM